MKKIILDTNALMAIAGFKVDIFSELEKACDFPFRIHVLSGTIDELKKIKEQQRGKYRRGAQLALSLLKAKKIPVILPAKEKAGVDNLLVEHSQAGDLILTQDIGLKKRLKKPYLTIRQKKKVELVS